MGIFMKTSGFTEYRQPLHGLRLRKPLEKKMIGKPYSGKLNVRFDEGELETAIRYKSW